ncbi:NAD-dependent epimerase/dehydratase family protein [Mesorhizobium xinjiangense]|uniref:NAD-dependent epimerase/dehydratase family protein n=1 Tax=Mesorhizobium xinjiangense TaxID=2678685 RepID=UPI0012ECF127|nr:NAD-dependent epimerase/dehydratase family protein [Mesorhizobium xinjiangense]
MILITGASGFIGTSLTRHFHRSGHTLRLTTRDPSALPADYGDVVATPAPEDGPQGWEPLLAGVQHVVHCAGIAHTGGVAKEAYRSAIVDLTTALAQACATNVQGKLVFLSSIRAVTGPVSDHIIGNETSPRPIDEYGRAKLDAEHAIAAIYGEERRYTILRPTLVYGEGARGNLASLLALARLPLPLPLGGLKAKRSLLDIDACARAIEHSLDASQTDGATYVVSDAAPMSTADIVTAFRRGLGRSPGLFALPAPLLAAGLKTAGLGAIWSRLSGSLVADPSALTATGWLPVEDSRPGLERIARNAAAQG